MPPRLAPLDPDPASPAGEILARFPAGPDGPLHLFATLAHHDDLLERFGGLGGALLQTGRLPDADREAVIHRVTAAEGAEYEWGVHAVAFAPALGYDEAWLTASVHGGPQDVDEPSRLLFTTVDEVRETGTIGDATWTALRERYADDQLVELVCLIGFYRLVANVCRVFAVEHEAWARRFPDAPGGAR